MKVAIVSPLVESVPPILYGGTERVASALTEELVKRGHDVTLFASGDSHTSAQLVACAPRALRLDPEVRDYVAYTLIECGDIYDRAREFDLIHNHVDYFAFPFARMSLTPTVTTVHGRLDLEEVRRTYAHFPEQRLISISHNQASTLPHANWIANVYNGIDMEKFRFRSEPGDYLVFLGRISPEKRPDRAIEIARDVGMRLLIAAKVDPADEVYYHAAVEPLINRSPLVEFVGEVDEAAKDDLLGGAYACLFPIDWPEPFGLTMIESMATGTPVVAYRSGSVPEVIVDGETGFIRDTLTGMVEAVEQVKHLNRARCREHVEQNFSAASMASQYEAVYNRVLEGQRSRSLLAQLPSPTVSATEQGSQSHAMAP
jgi:glycosyltransferase involved in cell wall biosynthesis